MLCTSLVYIFWAAVGAAARTSRTDESSAAQLRGFRKMMRRKAASQTCAAAVSGANPPNRRKGAALRAIKKAKRAKGSLGPSLKNNTFCVLCSIPRRSSHRTSDSVESRWLTAREGLLDARKPELYPGRLTQGVEGVGWRRLVRQRVQPERCQDYRVQGRGYRIWRGKRTAYQIRALPVLDSLSTYMDFRSS